MERRRLVKEGTLKESKQGEVTFVTLLVFSDVILFAHKEKPVDPNIALRLVVHRSEYLGNIKVEDQELDSGNILLVFHRTFSLKYFFYF